MDIKDKLAKELAKASNLEEQRQLQQKALQAEAIELFKPIADAVKELKKELSNTKGLSIVFGENRCSLKLGNKELECSRNFFDREFIVYEDVQWDYPSYEIDKETHHFETSNEVIEFLVKECAKYVVTVK